jgi:large subunit ribosomal protein L10
MNVEQSNVLRQNFTDNSIDYLVSKNTLIKIAINNAGYDNKIFDEFLNVQVAVAYAKEDPIAPARVIKEFCKENECLEVVGLYFEGEVYNPEKYKELADLPSKEELITKFVVGLNYPMTSLAISLKCTMIKFVNVLNDLKDKKN